MVYRPAPTDGHLIMRPVATGMMYIWGKMGEGYLRGLLAFFEINDQEKIEKRESKMKKL
jgi:hypothetical protein